MWYYITFSCQKPVLCDEQLSWLFIYTKEEKKLVSITINQKPEPSMSPGDNIIDALLVLW